VNGIGQTPNDFDLDDGMVVLQGLIADWQRRRWLVWDLVDYPLLSTGAQSYSVGPAGNFAMPRPDRIVSAFARLQAGGANQCDYYLNIIEAREDYNKIALKQISTFPAHVFYDSAWPTGTVYFWPVPVSGQFELHLTVKASLPVFVNLSDPINLPPEYMRALRYGIAVEATILYGRDPHPGIIGAYRVALDAIRTANLQIATLDMPAGVVGRQRGGLGMVGQGLSRAFTLDGGSVLT
jgi:hypothetical protein